MRGWGVEGVTGLGGSGEGRGCLEGVAVLGGSGEGRVCGGCDWSRRVR